MLKHSAASLITLSISSFHLKTTDQDTKNLCISASTVRIKLLGPYKTVRNSEPLSLRFTTAPLEVYNRGYEDMFHLHQLLNFTSHCFSISVALSTAFIQGPLNLQFQFSVKF